MLVREMAELLHTTFEGDGDRPIAGVAALESAAKADLSFVGSKRALREAQASAAGCLIVPLDFDNSGLRTIIRAKDPRGAFAKVTRALLPAAGLGGIHSTALIGENCTIAEDVQIGPYCVIGDRVQIRAGSKLYAHVTVYSDVSIGERVIIHSGAVLGADGFGYVMENNRYEKFPQIGRVDIADDVEIGANAAVDRAALGVTSIGEGTKLDNMVHIGHNCRIGRHVVIAAQTGVAGSSIIEDYAVLGGQVGVADNVTIQSRAIVGAKSGIPSSKVLRGNGEVYWGLPARPIKDYLEGQANLGKIPDLRKEVAELKLRLQALEKEAGQG